MQKAPGSQRSCIACDKTDSAAHHRQKDESPEEFEERSKLQSRLCRIPHRRDPAGNHSTHHGIERQRFKGVLK